ncbi:MAG: hypothetical protein DRO40_10685 [Thermoprotei archaeon]|nr:MAG: hypothetical protein DRO40_10685 [Thermoprotei archaeon]
MRLEDLGITLLDERKGKNYLTLYHGKIKLFARKYNTDVAKQVARIAIHHAKILVLPSLIRVPYWNLQIYLGRVC